MISQAVNTVFIYPGAGDQAMLEALAQAGLNLIGGVLRHPLHWLKIGSQLLRLILWQQ